MFDKRLLDVIACPVCKGKLLYSADQNALICRFDRLKYSIEQGIPVLIEDKAEQISAEELSDLKSVSYTHLTLPTIYSV